MTAVNFCYWLQGFFEVAKAGIPEHPDRSLNSERVKLIERHLAMVFAHDIDPSAGGPEVQKKLDDIHVGAGSKETTVYRC